MVDKKLYMKKWQYKNKDKRRAYMKMWNGNNKDKVANYRREYSSRNKDRLNAYQRKWRDENSIYIGGTQFSLNDCERLGGDFDELKRIECSFRKLKEGKRKGE